uniref:Uncharacterized protein n=1 Tax=Anguilla anguilla TaxID=7936 RepID=A0A0E9TJU5_ANGAN
MKAMNWPKNEEADVCNWQLTTENIALKNKKITAPEGLI